MVQTWSRLQFPPVRVAWFCDRPGSAACFTLAEFKQCTTAARHFGFVRRPFHTKLVDLRLAPDELLAGFQARARSMVRQAEKLGVTSEMESDRARFIATYNELAMRRGLAKLAHHHPLTGSAPSAITAARLGHRTLVMRGYLVDREGSRVRNLVSCTALHDPDDTETAKLTGLAHRLLVYADMLMFRSRGSPNTTSGATRWRPRTPSSRASTNSRTVSAAGSSARPTISPGHCICA